MNSREIFEKRIAEEIEKISSKSDEFSEEVDYLEDFFMNCGTYKSKSGNDFMQLSCSEILKVLVCLNRDQFKQVSLDSIEDDAEFICISLDTDVMKTAYGIIKFLKAYNCREEFTELMKSDGNVDLVKAFSFFYKFLKSEVEGFEFNYDHVKELLFENLDVCLIFIDIFYEVEDDSIFDSILLYLEAAKDLASDISDDFFTLFETSNSENIKKFWACHNEWYTKYTILKKQEKNQLKKRRKDLSNYSTFLNKYSKIFNQLEITNISNLVELLADDSLKRDFIKLVFDYNQEYYQSLETKYKEMEFSSVVHYVEILKKYQLDFLSLDPQLKHTILDIPLKECDNRLKIVRGSFYYDQDLLFTLLVSCNEERLIEIDNFFKQGVFTKDFLKNNVMLVTNPSTYQNFVNNLEFLSSVGIAPIRFQKCTEVLFNEVDLVQRNILLLQEYGCNIVSRKVVDFRMLAFDDLEERVDSLIECGLENELLNNVEILNSDSRLTDRIKLCQLIGSPYVDDLGHLLDSVLDKNKFFASEEDVDLFFPKTKFSLEGIEESKLIEESSLTYRYGDRLISKKRLEKIKNKS